MYCKLNGRLALVVDNDEIFGVGAMTYKVIFVDDTTNTPKWVYATDIDEWIE